MRLLEGNCWKARVRKEYSAVFYVYSSSICCGLDYNCDPSCSIYEGGRGRPAPRSRNASNHLFEVIHAISTKTSSFHQFRVHIGALRNQRDKLDRRLLTHQNLLLYSLLMVASALSTKKAVALFHALSDETRLALLDRLKDGEQCVCELTDAMKAAQSRLSFHLKVLKDAGLVEDRREGRWMYYSLSAQALEELEDLVESLKKAAKSAGFARRCC